MPLADIQNSKHKVMSVRVRQHQKKKRKQKQQKEIVPVKKLYNQIKLSLLYSLVLFSNPRCPLRFYQYSGDRASHYAAPTTLALSPLVTDRPAIVPATAQCALTLNSLAGRLPVSASSRNTRRLGSHEGNLEYTCHCQWHTA